MSNLRLTVHGRKWQPVQRERMNSTSIWQFRSRLTMSAFLLGLRGYFLANFVGVLAAFRTATQIAGQILRFLDGIVSGVLDDFCVVGQSHVLQHHHRREQQRRGICFILASNIWCRSVHLYNLNHNFIYTKLNVKS